MHKNTLLYNISTAVGGWQVPSNHFIFFEGSPMFVEGGGVCAMAKWHNGQSKREQTVQGIGQDDTGRRRAESEITTRRRSTSGGVQVRTHADDLPRQRDADDAVCVGDHHQPRPHHRTARDRFHCQRSGSDAIVYCSYTHVRRIHFRARKIREIIIKGARKFEAQFSTML